jgi:hypothetical protein
LFEHVEPARDRGFLAELPYDEYAGRDIKRGYVRRVASVSVVSGARRIPYGSMEASQWEVDLCSLI